MFKAKVDDEINLCMLHPSFAATYVQMVKENYDYLSQWLGWPEKCQTEEDFLDFIRDSLHKYADGRLMYCAIEYQGRIVGNAGFNSINHELKTVEIGYWLAAEYQGKGIMTRTCQYLIEHAFHQMGMEKVQIAAAKENKPSRAVCERLGMNLEGILTRREKVGDRILDHAVYGLHKKAYG